MTPSVAAVVRSSIMYLSRYRLSSCRLAESRDVLKAAKKSKKKTLTAYNYRRVPAVALAKQLIQEGRIGEIYHWRAVYLQDWIMDPDFPLVWRLKKNEAGSGPHGDLNAHITDLAMHLVGAGSYTHLTPPTSGRVWVLGGAVVL